MAKGAILYLRYSTTEQAEGQSEQRQCATAERWCKEHECPLLKTYKDLGISGGKSADDRRGLKTLLGDLESGEVPEYLLIEDVDRLSRMLPLDSLNLISRILDYGVTIVSLRDSQMLTKANWQSSQSFLILSLKTTLANEERQKRIFRGKAAWKQKRADAKNKIYTKKIPSWLTVKDGKIVIIPKHVETVKRMFKLSSEGVGIVGIIRLFNDEGVESFRGKSWNKAVIHNTLTNESVLGFFQPRTLVNGKRIEDGEKIANYFPQIIESELFHHVQAKLKQRSTYKGGGFKNPKQPYRHNLFAGIMKCAKCGDSMIRLARSRHGYMYLVCTNANKNGGCKFKTVTTHILEEMFVDWVFHDRRFLAGLKPQSVSSVNVISQKLEAVRKKLQRYMTFVDESDGLPPRTIVAKVSEFESQVQFLEQELDKAKLEEAQNANLPTKLGEMCDNVDEDLKTSLGRARVASLLKDCIASMVVDTEHCRMLIEWKKSVGYGKTDRLAWNKKDKEWWYANSHWDCNDDEGYRTLWCLQKKEKKQP
jgi:DNA invertase Pin-like site-specific DNA recombinase/ssDNA-binding Zn-finger/Zn-ribbon topoisomerase 1